MGKATYIALAAAVTSLFATGVAFGQELVIQIGVSKFLTIPALGIPIGKDAGEFPAIAGALSLDGKIVVGGTGDVGDVAFSWSRENGVVSLGDLPGGDNHSWAEGINSTGEIVVGSSSHETGKTQAVLWSKKYGIRPLGFLPGGNVSSASGVSPDGNVIVGKSETIREGKIVEEPFVWTEATGMQSLGAIDGASEGEAFVVTSDGSQIGGQSGGTPFLWSRNKGFTRIDRLSTKSLPTDDTAGMNVICAIAERGKVAGGGMVTERSFPKSEAFLWDETGGTRVLGDLDGGLIDSIVYAISPDGRIAVGKASTESGDEAFIWDNENGMRRLQSVVEAKLNVSLTDIVLRHAISISGDGRTIAGVGERSGKKFSWIYVSE